MKNLASKKIDIHTIKLRANQNRHFKIAALADRGIFSVNSELTKFTLSIGV